MSIRDMIYEEKLLLELLVSRFAEGSQFDMSNACKKVNWKIMFDVLMKQKMYMCCYADFANYLPVQFKVKWKSIYQFIKMKINRDIEKIARVQAELEKSHLYTTIAKGFVFSQLVYGGVYKRQYSDVDMYVDPDIIYDVGCNLLQSEYDVEIFSDSKLAGSIDVKGYFEGREECILVDKANLSHPLEIKPIDIDGKLNAATIRRGVKESSLMRCNDSLIRVFDIDTAVYYMLMNAYKNYFMGYGRLHQCEINTLFDVASWMSNNGDYCYDKVIEIAQEEGAISEISAILSLAIDVFKIEHVSNIEKYFVIDHRERNEEIHYIFSYEYAHQNYRSKILENTIYKCFAAGKRDDPCVLPSKIRIPIKNVHPQILAAQNDKRDIDVIVDIDDSSIPVFIDVVVWSQGCDDSRKIGRVSYNDGIIGAVSNEIDNAEFLVEENKVVCRITDICDEYIYVTDDMESILLEVYVYWDKKYSKFDSWLTVGWDFSPVILRLMNE